MHYYRLYLLDPEGRFDRAVEMECRGDADALGMLREHAERHPIMELWNRERLVARHGAIPAAAERAPA